MSVWHPTASSEQNRTSDGSLMANHQHAYTFSVTMPLVRA